MEEWEDGLTVEEKETFVELSWWERIQYTFVQPSKTMKYLAEKPKILFPVLVIIIGFLGFTLLKMDLFMEFTKQQMILQMQKMGTAPLTEIPDEYVQLAMWFGMGGTVVVPALFWFGKGLVIHLVAKAFNGTGKLKPALSAVGYSYLIIVLGEGIRTVIALVTKNYLVLTSLALFLPDTQMGTPLYTLLGSLDVFSLWYLTVLTIGLSHTHQIDTKKSGLIVFGSWAAMILISVTIILIRS